MTGCSRPNIKLYYIILFLEMYCIPVCKCVCEKIRVGLYTYNVGNKCMNKY